MCMIAYDLISKTKMVVTRNSELSPDYEFSPWSSAPTVAPSRAYGRRSVNFPSLAVWTALGRHWTVVSPGWPVAALFRPLSSCPRLVCRPSDWRHRATLSPQGSAVRRPSFPTDRSSAAAQRRTETRQGGEWGRLSRIGWPTGGLRLDWWTEAGLVRCFVWDAYFRSVSSREPSGRAAFLLLSDTGHQIRIWVFASAQQIRI